MFNYKLTQNGATLAQPEFVDHKQAYVLFGLTRSHLYQLWGEGKIRSVSLRQPGKIKGRRLFDCASIREFLRGNYAASQPAAKEEVK